MRPILFDISIGSVDLYIYSYIFFSVLSVALVLIFTFLSFRKNGINCIISLSGILMILAFTFIGARLIGVLYKYPFYIDGLDKIISIKYGDFSLFGGLILAVIVGLWFVRKNKLPLWQTMDIFAPSLAIGQSVGRIGCFMAGCCYGRESHLPWAVTFTDKNSLARLGVSLHPVQLYSSFTALIIFIILVLLRRKKPFHGFLIEPLLLSKLCYG